MVHDHTSEERRNIGGILVRKNDQWSERREHKVELRLYDVLPIIVRKSKSEKNLMMFRRNTLRFRLFRRPLSKALPLTAFPTAVSGN